MADADQQVEQERQMLADANAKGGGAKVRTFMKLSGPGWLQSAITLGGGSLASSLFLGILGGMSLLWVQPFAMILGIIMLSAIGYVTLSTGERPFQAIRNHVNPVMAWGWALAVAAANIVWCLPQFSLANGVLSQNLLPGVLGPEGAITKAGGANASMAAVSVSLLLICTIITWSYDRGGWGIRMYEWVLKAMVAFIVICFVGVVAVLTSRGVIDWSAVTSGLIPKFGQFFRPADTFAPLLDAIGAVGDPAREYWSNFIVDKQQDIIFSAAATAVGINMTFLFPYSLLRKGWTKEFRGLAIFDLATGMFIPYVLATGCVVIASAGQFHTKLTDDFVVSKGDITPPERLAKPYNKLLDSRGKKVSGDASLAEKKLAATLVNRKARDLSGALEPLTGRFVADIVFGFGVLAMALSTISLLMLISGFVFCEMFGLPQGGWPHRIGTLVAGAIGATGPFVWGGASFYLAVPTSVFGLALLPFAYITFVLLMNQRTLLGDNMPKGARRLLWNVLMGSAATIATAASLYVIYKKSNEKFGNGWYGLAGVGVLLAIVLIVQFTRKPAGQQTE